MWKWVIVSVGVVLAIPALFILVESVRDYSPPQIVDLKSEGEAQLATPSELTIFTWNIGYAGLGKEMDFFADGGRGSITPKDLVERYVKGILSVVDTYRYITDVFFFQEVDRDSDRSHHIDEYDKLKKLLVGYKSVFAYNYVVDFVPLPLYQPMGKVLSGMAIFSRYDFHDPKRVALPGQYPWPENLFYLDRCMIVVRIPAPNGKEWVLINTHNSAFDSGDQRKQQLEFIKKFILKEYEKGNYVVIGGDWNLMLGGNFEYTEKPEEFYIPFPKDWTPKGWKWAFDEMVPTNRSLKAPYKKGETFVAIIDGFLVSPNVEVISVNGIDQGFEYSDHNPVVLKVRAK
jgi:endonuclease/exonuclease/phosphatase family metal-dependent hydrolase